MVEYIFCINNIIHRSNDDTSYPTSFVIQIIYPNYVYVASLATKDHFATNYGDSRRFGKLNGSFFHLSLMK